MRLLFFGTYDVATHPRVQVLREGFEALGHDVVEVNAPLGIGTAERILMLQRPWLAVRLLTRLARRWFELWRRGRAVGPVDAVVVGYMGHFDVLLARLLFRDRMIVLDHLISARDTARDRGVATPWKEPLLATLDRAATGTADVVVVDTAEHVELLPRTGRRNAVVVPVGAPEVWFHGADRPRPDGRASVVFFGLYTPLQGAPTIGRALRLAFERGAELDVTMVGAGQEFDATRAAAGELPSVKWIPWVDASELPGLVSEHDVCLGIFGTGPKARRVVPNKVFQGAASGCAIVTSDTRPQRELLGDAATFVAPGDPDALADALVELAAAPDLLAERRAAARAWAEERFRPTRVVADLADHVGRLLVSARPVQLHVFLGTKAQYIKTAPLLRLLDERGIAYRLIDSGQHAGLSPGLREQLGVRPPDLVLGGDQDVDTIPQAIRWTARLAGELVNKNRLREEVFDGAEGICVVHGDTPSTLLAAVLARRAGLRVAHLEAGLRSHHLLHPFPEELIRVLVMRVSDLLFAPDEEAVANLAAMRVGGRVVPVSGNTVTEALRRDLGGSHEAGRGPVVVTMHRVENLNRPGRVARLIGVIERVASERPVTFVVHGPTAETLARTGADDSLRAAGVELRPLLAHAEFVELLAEASFVITDGGSIQEECALLGVPTLLWREHTERPDGIGANVVLSRYSPGVIRRFLADPEAYRRPAAPMDANPSEEILASLLAELR